MATTMTCLAAVAFASALLAPAAAQAQDVGTALSGRTRAQIADWNPVVKCP